MGRVEVYEEGIEELAHDPEGDIAHALERDAYAVENEVKRRMLEPGSGYTYLPGHYVMFKAGKWYAWNRDLPPHTASEPGAAPSSDTGLLLASIQHVADENDDGIFYRVGSEMEISEYLELGTRLMEPRPVLRPALDVIGTDKIVDESATYGPAGPADFFEFTPLPKKTRVRKT